MSILKKSKKKHTNYKTKKYIKKSTKSTKSTKLNKTSSKKKNTNLKLIKLHAIKLSGDLHNNNNNHNNDNDNINYKLVFSNNKKINKDIIFLKKLSFDIFYSNKYKYPLLVVENITKKTGKSEDGVIMRRADIPDPWSLDKEIDKKNTLTFNNDYDTYEYYGGSAGHNAPSVNHKLNMNDYKETYLISNITPQNINLNMGLWVLLENWCNLLSTNNKLNNIYVFTGSIPNSKPSILFNAKLEKSILNIPIQMYKIVCFKHIDYPGSIFMEIFIFNNKSININLDKILYNFSNYLLPIKSYKWFENTTGINIIHLLQYYKFNINHNNNHNHNYNHTKNHISNLNKIKSFRNIINLNFKISKKSHILLYKAYLYNLMMSSTTLKDLYNNYNKTMEKYELLKDDIKYIKHYFYKYRNKLIRDVLLYENFNKLNEFDTFFNDFKNELNTKYKIDKEEELENLDISQDDYLDIYYNIVKNKLKK